MTTQTIEIQLPEPLFRRFRDAADENAEPMEVVLLQALEANPPPPSMAMIPPAAQDAVRALRDLSDDELWPIARGKISATQQRRMEELLAKNGRGELTEDESIELDRIAETVDIQTVVKAYAYTLLRWHGHLLPRVGNIEESP